MGEQPEEINNEDMFGNLFKFLDDFVSPAEDPAPVDKEPATRAVEDAAPPPATRAVEDAAPPSCSYELLDTRLDCLMRMLEGEDVKSCKLTDDQYDAILECVKQTQQWKKSSRTAQEIQAKINEISALMARTVYSLG